MRASAPGRMSPRELRFGGAVGQGRRVSRWASDFCFVAETGPRDDVGRAHCLNPMARDGWSKPHRKLRVLILKY